ncbi:Putative glycosyl transferase group 1 [Herminiimonas arsenicoxydans]|uniref:Glycosyl transferase group 1 n=1 Tax=Herminiimonas arsenicoxydans TaxID=204773 RepID=A4G473_HERAR|nr:Putative glycosyl transferase group 1 [Herminiimonas arsenicoxydans]
MIDVVNAIEERYDHVVFASNKNGIFSEDIARLNRPAIYRHIWFISRSSMDHALRFIHPITRRIILAPLILAEPFFFLANLMRFMLLLRSVKPAYIVSCNGGYPAAQSSLAMVVAARILRLPVVLSVVSMPVRRRAYFRHYESFIDKLVWKSVNVVIVNAKAILKSLHELRDMPLEKARVVYNGLEDMPPKITNTMRDQSLVNIGCVARMDAAKGVFFLLDAFAYLAKEHPELRLILAGDGNASADLLRRAGVLGIQDQVQFLGHYSGDTCALLNTFDIYVFPSLWEGFPYSIVEALRSACTIVATDVGGIPEAITNGVNGILIKPGSADAIIEAIEQLLSDAVTRDMLARNARLKFESDLELKKMHGRVREIVTP